VLTDDRPGAEHSYKCPSCGRTYPPTPEQEAERLGSDEQVRLASKERAEAARQGAAAGNLRFWCPDVKLTKRQEADFKRAEREREILEKTPEQLTPAEWKWLEKAMARVVSEKPQGQKRAPQYDEWSCQIARARFQGRKPPRLRELAGIKPPKSRAAAHDHTGDLQGEYKASMDLLRDRFKKAKKIRELPVPPKR
jgi:hypothetical protein